MDYEAAKPWNALFNKLASIRFIFFYDNTMSNNEQQWGKIK